MSAATQLVVPAALPDPPAAFDHVTVAMPPALEAVPRSVIAASDVETMVKAGEVMRRAGKAPPPSCRVTVRLRASFVPAASVAVIVITFAPALSGTAAMVHRAVPDAVPEAPRSLRHVTVAAF